MLTQSDASSSEKHFSVLGVNAKDHVSTNETSMDASQTSVETNAVHQRRLPLSTAHSRCPTGPQRQDRVRQTCDSCRRPRWMTVVRATSFDFQRRG